MIKITAFRGRGPQEFLFNPKFIKIVRPSKGERCAPPGANSMMFLSDDELYYCTQTVDEIEMAIKADVDRIIGIDIANGKDMTVRGEWIE